MHAQLVHVRLGLHHHIDQVRDRRALVAPDVGHAGLQQGLGDGQDALAVKRGSRALAQLLDFLAK